MSQTTGSKLKHKEEKKMNKSTVRNLRQYQKFDKELMAA